MKIKRLSLKRRIPNTLKFPNEAANILINLLLYLKKSIFLVKERFSNVLESFLIL